MSISTAICLAVSFSLMFWAVSIAAICVAQVIRGSATNVIGTVSIFAIAMAFLVPWLMT